MSSRREARLGRQPETHWLEEQSSMSEALMLGLLLVILALDPNVKERVYMTPRIWFNRAIAPDTCNSIGSSQHTPGWLGVAQDMKYEP